MAVTIYWYGEDVTMKVLTSLKKLKAVILKASNTSAVIVSNSLSSYDTETYSISLFAFDQQIALTWKKNITDPLSSEVTRLVDYLQRA